MPTWVVIVVVIAVLGYFMLRSRTAGKGVEQISGDQLRALLDDKAGAAKRQFIDVREPFEYRGGHIRGMKNIPVGEIGRRLPEIRKDAEVVVMCRSGHRSMMAARTLKKNGYDHVLNVQGGIGSWRGPLQK
ncbi:MAG: rhodanese-like domain-containing protein [Firmicutes bacterium]|nr:rhodanese-like domain-containing protein [Bacillota bacterium]